MSRPKCPGRGAGARTGRPARASAPAPGAARPQEPGAGSSRGHLRAAPRPATTGAASSAVDTRQGAARLNYPKPHSVAGRIQLSNWAQVATAADRATDADHRADRFLVEVHKKWAISMACISFVIIGIVMALRFPRGGIGLVIGGGLLIFSVHYVGLTAGESLADRGLRLPMAGDVDAEHRPDPRRAARPGPGEPGIGLDPWR